MAAPASSAPSVSAASTAAATPLTAQQQEWMDDPQAAFELGVELAFERWEDLNMSVENGWCGGVDVGEKLRDELIDATIDWFYSAKDKLHWDEVSDFLYDALSDHFHVHSETREEERIARLLTTLYDDCLQRADFSGLQRMVATRRQVWRARTEATRKVREDMAVQDEEDEEGDEEEEGEGEGDGEDGDGEAGEGGYGDGVEERMQRMTVAEGKEEDHKQGDGDDVKEGSAEPKVDEEDGWTTVGVKQKGKKTGR